MRRIVVLCEYTSLNGGERSLLATFDVLRTWDFELCVLCPPTGPLVDHLATVGVDHAGFPFRDRQDRKYPLDVLRRRLRDVLARIRPWLVHANSVSTSRLSGPTLRCLGLPSIGHLRDMLKLSNAAIADLNQHPCLVAVSAATRKWFINAGVDSTRIVVCYNGVDTRVFQPRPASGYLHSELGLSREELLVGAIGQIGLRKGWEVLLAAMEPLVRRLPNVHLLVIGQRFSNKDESRQYERQLHQAADTPGLQGHVHFLGYRDDVARIMNELALVVHAAHQEPLGRVLLEAAAAGKAIVATDVGGTKEIFPPNSNSALLVPPKRPEVLATAIATLLKSPDQRLALEIAARQRAVAFFDARDAARRIAAVYEQVGAKANSSQT